MGDTLEQTLGFRIVPTGLESGGYQAQRLVFDGDGKPTVASVAPAQEREFTMYELLRACYKPDPPVVVDAAPSAGQV